METITLTAHTVGQVFVAHFELGGTFLNFDTEKGKNFVSSEKTAEAKAT